MAKKYTLSRKRADKFRLYELAVQDPATEVDLALKQYRRRRGRRPLVLREDFCGTAAVACAWVAGHPKARAIALDLDQATLEWAGRQNVAPLGDAADRIQLRRKDVRSVTSPKADVVQAFNLSSYLFYPTAELVTYFRCVRRSLAPGGIFMLDGYGGWEATQTVQERRTVKSPEGTFGYVWDQAAFNPIDNLGVCHIHFEFKNGKRWKRAFSYEWRVYSPVEVCEALTTAGFTNIEVLWDFSEDDDTSDFRPTRSAENSPGWLIYIIADGPEVSSPDAEPRGRGRATAP